MTNINFIEWLKAELENKGWTQAEFSRQTKLSPAQITRLLNGERGVGENAIIAIAHALRLPPETVFRAAGILPQQSPESELIEQIKHLTQGLPPQDQNEILEYIKLRHKLSEQREINGIKRTRSKPSLP